METVVYKILFLIQVWKCWSKLYNIKMYLKNNGLFEHKNNIFCDNCHKSFYFATSEKLFKSRITADFSRYKVMCLGRKG